MGVFRRFGGNKTNGEVSPETAGSAVRKLVPQDRKDEAIKAALDGVGITMSSGELREAVIDICSALIVQRLYPLDKDEFSLAQSVIDGRSVDLGRDRHALGEADGDPEKAVQINLKKIGEAIGANPAHNDVVPLQEAPSSAELTGSRPEPPLAAA